MVVFALNHNSLQNIEKWLYPEVEQAVEDVCNEGLNSETERYPVSVILMNKTTPDTVRRKIEKEFATILKLLDFNNKVEILGRWYRR